MSVDVSFANGAFIDGQTMFNVMAVMPFALMLLAVMLLPACKPDYWEHWGNQLRVALLLAAPVLLAYAYTKPHVVLETFGEYVTFVALLGSLFVISSGIVITVGRVATPWSNTLWLLSGACLASVLGTTGASMLLIRGLLQSNQHRPQKAHIVCFFIFIVSNAGGLLTPLGDPPLFLGFLRGLNFFWTLELLPIWVGVNAGLLGTFFVVDTMLARRAPATTCGPKDSLSMPAIRIRGGINLVWLSLVILSLMLTGIWPQVAGLQVPLLMAWSFLSWYTTPRQIRLHNQFSWQPLREVMIVFFGIFATMPPALERLSVLGKHLGLHAGWQYFWLTGVLSSILDNAPTYLVFTAAASKAVGTDPHQLAALAQHPQGAAWLKATAAGAVLMGALTYIGNGPNMMVRAVAEQLSVTMPSFARYSFWAAVVWLPLLFGVTFFLL